MFNVLRERLNKIKFKKAKTHASVVFPHYWLVTDLIKKC
jgi:hypothetical protein